MSSRDTTSHVAPPRRKTTAQIDVQIGARYAAKVKARLLRQAAQATLEQQRIRTRKELTLVITGNAQLRALNRTFRQIDAPTDVLSFATDEVRRPTTLYLGDVIISYPKAREQARAGGHALEAELQLLVTITARWLNRPACGKPRLLC